MSERLASNGVFNPLDFQFMIGAYKLKNFAIDSGFCKVSSTPSASLVAGTDMFMAVYAGAISISVSLALLGGSMDNTYLYNLLMARRLPEGQAVPDQILQLVGATELTFLPLTISYAKSPNYFLHSHSWIIHDIGAHNLPADAADSVTRTWEFQIGGTPSTLLGAIGRLQTPVSLAVAV